MVGAVALLLSLQLRMLIDSLIFFPERDVPPPPPGIEERWLTTADGVRLHAWYGSPEDPVATLVWSHGNGGNIAGRVDVLRDLVASGLAVLAYDYRGYGKSDGRPSEAGLYADAAAAYDDIRRRGVPAERIVAFGESLGGAVSIRLATERPCAAVAVVSTFTRIADVARVHYGALATMVGGRFDSRMRVGTLGVPLFVAHGDRDEIVPYELGAALFAAAREPKRFLAVGGAGHNDVFAFPEVVHGIAAFARDVTRR